MRLSFCHLSKMLFVICVLFFKTAGDSFYKLRKMKVKCLTIPQNSGEFESKCIALYSKCFVTKQSLHQFVCNCLITCFKILKFNSRWKLKKNLLKLNDY